MCKSEYDDRHECRYHPSYEELKEESTRSRIQKALKGQLSYTTEEWIKARRKAV